MDESRATLRASAFRDRVAWFWRATERVGLHEVVVVVVSFLIYFVIRGLVVGRAGEAMVRGIRLIELEQRLGIYWELEMQSWILDSYWLIKAMNWVYFWGHMPLVIVFAVWLWVWHRHTYTLVRNAFLASGAIGVVVYWLYPVAPPRLIPFAGFIDTMAMFDRVGYNAQETKGLVNQFAAVPSLHFGWSMLLGLAVARVGKRPILWVFGIAWPVAMFFAVVMTGNHFILDAVIGAAVSFAGLGIAMGLERARPRAVAWAKGRLGPRGVEATERASP
ncbi:MAG: phosphatase PAP2 family protein [Thermoflexaceae bacterium]|nr:phosphatase PAP2 family protein [Thermoflexaceae bacterium]